MASGIPIAQQCLEKFQQLKAGKKFKYLIFGVSPDNKEIVVLEESKSDDYDDFLEKLPERECRYAVYDFEYEKEEGGKRNKLCFISWSPDDARVRAKMVHAASKDALRQSLVGIAAEIQGTSFDEVSREAILDKVSRGA